MVSDKNIELLQFDKIIQLIKQKCCGKQAKLLCDTIFPKTFSPEIVKELNQTNEIKVLLAANGYFPGVDHDDITEELVILNLEGSLLHETQLLLVLKTTEVINTLIRFLKGKKATLPYLFELSENITVCDIVVDEINRIIDAEAQVKSNASGELSRIRKQISEKRRESDKRFYNHINDLRKHGYLRDNEEGFFNGRRTGLTFLMDEWNFNGQ